MLYQSLKSSIAEYNKKHKKDQSKQQKTVFRWKIGTLGLCILAIVMIGALSQLYKQIQSIEPYDYNTNFLPILLTQSQQLDRIPLIKNFIQGLRASTPKVQFKSAQLLYEGTTINSTQIKSIINGKENLVYLWQFNNPIPTDDSLKFSFYFQKAFDSSATPQNDQIQIIQAIVDKASSIFNLRQLQSQRFNIVDDCALYSYNEVSNTFILGQVLRFDENSSQTVDFLMRNWRCFSIESEEQSLAKFFELTGIQIFDIKEPRPYTLNRLQIFRLEPIQ